MIGYEREELIGDIPPAYRCGEKRAEFQSLIGRVLAGENVVSEFDLIHKDGTRRAAEARSVKIEHQGKPRVLRVIRDIDEQKRRERELVQSEARYRGIFNASNDGLVYVCDRPNDRVQVFRTDGTFVQELFVAPKTLGDGSTWDIAFSRDPQQRFLYLADGKNMRIYIIERETMTILTSFGDGGRQPGQFFAVHSIATDSQGNIYTTETYEGKRVQKFVYKGMGPVTVMDQGTPWPSDRKSRSVNRLGRHRRTDAVTSA